jgi:3-methyl-2-oxobutanoate hydroxymethyltransferase
MVKLEGGAWLAPTVEFLVARGIPVCGHLGLQPQSVHRLGGYKAQGKTEASARALREDAQVLTAAGIDLLVLEMVPSPLAVEITAQIPTPTIGIGAGPGCSGQVLVLYDMLGIYPGKPARFVRNFMTGSSDVEGAVAAYTKAVKDGTFPGPEHCV